jgi:hypothetical protein
MTILSPEAIQDISSAVADEYKNALSKLTDAHEQMELISRILHPYTFYHENFSHWWSKYGFKTVLEFDGKLYSSAVFNKDGQELSIDERQGMTGELAKATLKKLIPLLYPETIELGQRTFPEYVDIWLNKA